MTMVNEKTMLPFETIAAATHGDTDAMCAILKHYENYIVILSQEL